MTHLFPTYRRANFLIFLACVALLATAYVMEYGFGMEPCKLCMFQRVAFFLIGGFALIAAIHSPATWGKKVYGVLIAASTLLGAGLSMRHLYLQSLPPEDVPDCGPPLDYMMDIMPIGDVIRDVLSGSGDCAAVSWQFLGLTIPGWTLVAFIGILLFALWANFRRWTPRHV